MDGQHLFLGFLGRARGARADGLELLQLVLDEEGKVLWLSVKLGTEWANENTYNDERRQAGTTTKTAKFVHFLLSITVDSVLEVVQGEGVRFVARVVALVDSHDYILAVLEENVRRRSIT